MKAIHHVSWSLPAVLSVILAGVSSDKARAGMDVDLIQLPTTIHTSTGGGTHPQFAYDGNFATSFDATAGPGNNGGYGVTITSEHAFASAHQVDSIVFRTAVHSYATGSYIRDHEGFFDVEYKAGGAWFTVAGSVGGFSAGDGDTTLDSGVITLAGLNLQAVTEVRALAHAFGNASGNEGNAGGDADIFELQAFGPDDTPGPGGPAVPAPGSLTLAVLGTLVLLGYGWRRRGKASGLQVA